jgi:hypothetical protein
MTNTKAKLDAINDTQRELEEQRKELAQLMRTQEELKDISAQLTQLRGQEFVLRKAAEDPKETEIRKQEMLLEAAHINEKITELDLIRAALENRLEEAEQIEANKKFDKYRTFSNIRELLKTSDVKIGQIEKEAGCQPGYMSRLDKPSNASEPSVEFLTTAAKMLNVSLDVLVLKDLVSLTPTEKYIISVMEKLQRDTIADKLEWKKEGAEYLNNLDCDINGYVDHPLFEYHEFYEEGEGCYPDLVNRITMDSDSFGYATFISGDCYNLKLKNNSILYLMDVSKTVYKVGDADAKAEEIWLYKPRVGVNFLVGSKSLQCGDLVHILFETVRESMRHPQIKKDIKSVLDAFMNDDFDDDDDDDDDDDEMPFK